MEIYHCFEIKSNCCQTCGFLTCNNYFQPTFGLFQHISFFIFLFEIMIVSSRKQGPEAFLLRLCCVFIFLRSPSSRSVRCCPSPITSAPPWDYSTNVCLKLSVLRGKITSALHPPREVNQPGRSDAGINQSHHGEGGQRD